MFHTLDRMLRHVFVALLIIALASVLTSCTDTTAPGNGTGAGSAGTEGVIAAASIDVSAFEFGYTASRESVPAGDVTFTLLNTGGMDHDLVLEGVDGAATDVIGPTETDTFTVTLEPGTYTLYCSVSNHRSLGMEIEITVR